MLSLTFRRELKGVVKMAIADAGGQENCANVSGRIKRHVAFSEYANLSLDDRHIPLDVAVEVDAFNGNGRIIGAAARMLGFVLVKLPHVAVSGSRLGRVTAQAMKETSEVFSTLGDALEDDVLSPPELADLEGHIDDAIVKLVKLKMQARLEVSGEGE